MQLVENSHQADIALKDPVLLGYALTFIERRTR